MNFLFIINKYNCSNEERRNSVYIGRGSKWGNPFIIGLHGNREEVIEMYKKHIMPKFTHKELLELKGKNLMCYCAPKKCHGNVLLEKIKNLEI